MDDLIPPNEMNELNKLAKAEKPSLLDSVLARNLDRVMQVYKTEPLTGEVRVWKTSLRDENPNTIDWAFEEYFRIGKFPPKPADIYEIIKVKKETPNFNDYRGMSEEEREAAARSRAGYFASDEYAQFLERMKKNHGL